MLFNAVDHFLTLPCKQYRCSDLLQALLLLVVALCNSEFGTLSGNNSRHFSHNVSVLIHMQRINELLTIDTSPWHAISSHVAPL